MNRYREHKKGIEQDRWTRTRVSARRMVAALVRDCKIHREPSVRVLTPIPSALSRWLTAEAQARHAQARVREQDRRLAAAAMEKQHRHMEYNRRKSS